MQCHGWHCLPACMRLVMAWRRLVAQLAINTGACTLTAYFARRYTCLC